MAQLTGPKQIFNRDTLTVDSSQVLELGTRAWDVNGNEYIYLQGTTSVVTRDWIVYDENYTTTRLTANEVGPVAVAATAVVIGEYGWFQVYGITQANTDTISADKSLYIDGTAGRVDDLSVSGDLVIGAYSMTASVSNVATVYITYPHVSDDIGGTAGGGITGPASSTDNAIVRWDGTDGTTVQNGSAIINDTGDLTGVKDLTITGDALLGNYTGSASIVTIGTIATGVWSATDVAVADGGTGASTAADARTNLGLVIGTDVQAFDNDLSDIAALSHSASAFIVSDGTDWLSRTVSQARENDLGFGTATASQATTGTGTAFSQLLTPASLAQSDYGKRVIQVLMTDPNATASGAGTGTSFVRIDSVLNNYRLVGFESGIATGSTTTGGINITARNVTKGYDIVSTPVWIDVSESDSSTSATAVVITTGSASVSTGDKIRLTTGGTGTATGIIATLIYQL